MPSTSAIVDIRTPHHPKGDNYVKQFSPNLQIRGRSRG
jgi:hypothetical protein